MLKRRCMMICEPVLVVILQAVFLAMTMPLMAQTSTGEIDVTVLDTSQALISGAKVTVIGADTGNVVRTLSTNASGLAPIPLLNPGTYDFRIEKDGFKTVLRTGIILQVTEVLSIRVPLDVGATSQSVTVAGETPLIETASNTLGQVVNSTTIQQLPLNGRNYTQLALLTPGTVPSVNKDQSFSAFGNRGMQNEYLLDGGLNESFIRGIDNHQRDAMRPSLEAIQEFKVQTSNFSAEYGASAGGVVSVVTRSGTNEIHGSAFEFLRNAAIAARNYFSPTGPVPQLVYNQFGGALGGPIKKNRAWIFGAYQGTQIRQQSVQISTVPTGAMKSGIFPASTIIYNPYTTEASGSGFARTPFPDNTIPQSLINTVGNSLVQFYPNPTRSGLANNYVLLAPLSTSLNNATFRGDVQVSSKDSMFGRFSLNQGRIQGEAALPEPANSPVYEKLPAYNVGYGYTRVFSPSFINELRFAFTRPEIVKDETQTKNEIVPNALAPGVDSGTPTFAITGYTGLGAQPVGLTNAPLDKNSNVWEISENATKNWRAHLFKFGFTYQFVQFHTFQALNGRGAFTFDGSYTQNPESRTGTGSAIADLLLGLSQQVQTSSTSTSNLQAQNNYWYFQDDWKATQRLNINLGVRYELYWPIIERNNRQADFVLDPSSPDYGHLIFAGLNGYSRSLMKLDKNNLAPRLGFAYRVPHSGDLTVRGGYGMFYGNPDEQTGGGAMMTQNPPFVGAGSVTLIGDRNHPSSSFNLSGSLPATQIITPQDFVLLPTSTTELYSWPRNYQAPLVNQWELSLQKQLPGEMVLELSYVGNTHRGNWNYYTANQPLTPGPGSVSSRRPLAQYTIAPVLVEGPWDHGNYEGITARLEKRMTHGLYFLASFTYGRAIDLSSGVPLDGCAYCSTQEAIQNIYDLEAQRGPSDSNVPRRVVFSPAWDLPFGKGQSFLQTGPLAYVAGGWQVSGIWSAQDGSPFTLALSVDNANVGNTNWPDRICGGRNPHPTVQNWFNQSCFVTAPQYTYGNAGRNVLYGPGMDNVDFALHRFFPIPIRELKMEFRAEFFNLLNHPEFSIPGNTLNLPTTGKITATSIPNREDQFALKLIW